MLRFTEDHEWLRLDGDVATVGITAHAAEQLGDLVFVELPKVGARLKKGDAAAVALVGKEMKPRQISRRHRDLVGQVAFADDPKHGPQMVGQPAQRFDKRQHMLLVRKAAHIRQHGVAGPGAQLLAQRRVALARMEEVEIDAERDNRDIIDAIALQPLRLSR